MTFKDFIKYWGLDPTCFEEIYTIISLEKAYDAGYKDGNKSLNNKETKD